MAESLINTEIESWPEQELRGHRIPGDRYTSREFVEQEWEDMWTKVWLLLGRESAVPQSRRLADGGGGPGIHSHGSSDRRQRKGLLQRLPASRKSAGRRAQGQRQALRLPVSQLGLHARWRAEFRAGHGRSFPEGNPCGKVRLEEVACETFAGFVWVNMDQDCVSLKEYLGPIWDDWSSCDLESWKRYHGAISLRLPCNWKVVLDNFNESYHVPTVHMAATPDTDRKKIRGNINTYYKETRFDLSDEGHNRMIMKGGYGVGVDGQGRQHHRASGQPAAVLGSRSRGFQRAAGRHPGSDAESEAAGWVRTAATPTTPKCPTSS